MSGSLTHRIVIGRVSNGSLQPAELRRVFRLRYDVFHQKLGWQVDGTDRQERDDYDTIDPYYMLAQNPDGASGCWRLLPTAGRYMLRNTFDALLRGEAAPAQNDIWELSRFAVTSPAQRYGGQIYPSALTMEMIAMLIRFADERRIRQYVTVTSTSVERLMVRAGIPMIRFGDGESTMIDAVESVACWIPVNRQFRDAVARAGLRDRSPA